MHRHSRTKRRDFLGKLVTRFLSQTLRPLPKAVAHRREQPLDLFWLELLR